MTSITKTRSNKKSSKVVVQSKPRSKPTGNVKVSKKETKDIKNDDDSEDVGDINCIDIDDIDNINDKSENDIADMINNDLDDNMEQNENNTDQIEWRKIPGYDKYLVSNTGLVKNSITNKLLADRTVNSYKYISLYYNVDEGKLKAKSMYLHRVVALTFIKNDDPTKTIVNHIDSNRLNNHVTNLEWVTIAENVRHGFTHGNHRATKRGVQKLDEEYNVLEEFESITDAGIKTGISATFIATVCKEKRPHAGGFRWKFTNENPNEVHNEEIDLSNFVKINDFPNYMISRTGLIYNIRFKKYMKATPNEEGYKYLNLSNNKNKKYFYVHRLVAEYFIPKVEGKDLVNHIDSNRQNNHVDNLEWCTNSENMLHANRVKRERLRTLNNNDDTKTDNDIEVDTTYVGKSNLENIAGNNHGVKRSIQKLDDDGNVLEEFESIKKAVEKTGIHNSGITEVCKGRRQFAGNFRWKFTNENPNEVHDKEINLSEYVKIKDFPNYLISKEGLIYGIKFKKFLKIHTGPYGDMRISLANNNGDKKFPIHILVAEHFLQKVKGKDIVCHIDGDKGNNRVDNLKWYNNAEKLLHTNKIKKEKSKILKNKDNKTVNDADNNDDDDNIKIIVRNKKKVIKKNIKPAPKKAIVRKNPNAR